MNCETCQEKLSLYRDHLLTKEEQEEVKAHLDLCETCTQAYNALKQMLGMLQEMPEVELPKTFHQDLMAKIKADLEEVKQEKVKQEKLIQERVKVIRKNNHLPRYFAGLAACMLIGFIFLNVGSGQKSETSRQAQYETAPGAVSEVPPENEENAQAFLSEESDSLTSQPELKSSRKIDREAEVSHDGAIKWQLELTDSKTFMENIKEYLSEEQCQYEERSEGLWITSPKDLIKIKNYIMSQEEVKTFTVLQETGEGLLLSWYE